MQNFWIKKSKEKTDKVKFEDTLQIIITQALGSGAKNKKNKLWLPNVIKSLTRRKCD